MSGQAIVVREHVANANSSCKFCGLFAHRWEQVACEPRLAAVPEGWDGDTVEVDDNTAAFLAARTPAISQAAQLADIQRNSTAPMTFCETCHTYILISNFERHCSELHP